jgi:hypothetical protein
MRGRGSGFDGSAGDEVVDRVGHARGPMSSSLSRSLLDAVAIFWTAAAVPDRLG